MVNNMKRSVLFSCQCCAVWSGLGLKTTWFQGKNVGFTLPVSLGSQFLISWAGVLCVTHHITQTSILFRSTLGGAVALRVQCDIYGLTLEFYWKPDACHTHSKGHFVYLYRMTQEMSNCLHLTACEKRLALLKCQFFWGSLGANLFDV